MKTAYVVGSVVAFTVGIGAALGINAYLSAKSELASVKAAAQTIATTQPAQAAQSTQVAATTVQPEPADFESLSLCDQMDAIAKSGKSVAQFIAESGRYSEFEANVRANCNWNTEQLNQAYAILNPPVITVQPQVVVAEPSQPVPKKLVPGKPWNNCNGIFEPGETYSPACDAAQRDNDNNPNPNHHDPLDNRPIDPKTGKRIDPNLPYDPNTGGHTGHKGYSANDYEYPPEQPSEPAPEPPADIRSSDAGVNDTGASDTAEAAEY